MKYFYLSFLLFISLNAHSQEELLGEWFLQSMTIDGVQNTDIPDGASINFTIESGDDDGLVFSGLGACEGFVGSYTVTSENSFDILAFYQTLSGCAGVNTEESIFESNYFYDILFSEGVTTNFNYEITGTGINTTLTLTNTSTNNIAVYGTSAPNPLVGEWFLYEILDFDVPVSNTNYPEVNIIFSEDMGNLSIQGTSTCNTFSGSTVNVENTYFDALPPTWTDLDCSGDETFDTDAYNFEQLYMQLFNYNFDEENSTPTRFYYNKTGFGENAVLELYNFNSQTNDGYYARFERQTLSISENELNKELIAIKSNPVESELHLIISESLDDQIKYQIVTIDGKQITGQTVLQSDMINVDNLSSGIYFIMMSSDSNFRQTLKFIKK